jgi:CheY-like chemotaxis protein
VDDEAAIREIVRATLETSGYRVLVAADGNEAVASYADHHGEIRLVLLDMMMPVMDGPSTVRALKRLDPHVCIVAASALTDNATAATETEPCVRALLPKPYSAEKLLRTLREVLETESLHADLGCGPTARPESASDVFSGCEKMSMDSRAQA